jgi:hypothetical protein
MPDHKIGIKYVVNEISKNNNENQEQFIDDEVISAIFLLLLPVYSNSDKPDITKIPNFSLFSVIW